VVLAVSVDDDANDYTNPEDHGIDLLTVATPVTGTIRE
jgi:hypothetical protein